jgi:exodeoxyribonuclease VII small subunit
VAKAAKNHTSTYKELASQLANILEWFESEDIDLDKAVTQYEKAMELLVEMETYLKTAENKVKKISTRFEP